MGDWTDMISLMQNHMLNSPRGGPEDELSQYLIVGWMLGLIYISPMFLALFQCARIKVPVGIIIDVRPCVTFSPDQSKPIQARPSNAASIIGPRRLINFPAGLANGLVIPNHFRIGDIKNKYFHLVITAALIFLFIYFLFLSQRE